MKTLKLPKLSKSQVLRDVGWSRSKKKMLPDTTMDKIFEANSSFHVKWRTTGKVQFLFFRSFLLVLNTFFFSEKDWVLGYNSINFWDFPDTSQLPKILSLKYFENSWRNSYIPCLLLITALRFTCGERKTQVSKISKILKILWPWL